MRRAPAPCCKTSLPVRARAADLHAALSNLPKPAHIIWGDQDHVLPPNFATLSERIPLHRMTGFGHVPHMDAFRQVNPLIAGFGA
jgi:pimeloyl-ACP methyl ester carboxylesterase